MGASDIVSGTLDLLVLQVLADGPRHGYAIGQEIKRRSEELLSIGENVLYPALHRLEARGDLSARWGKTPRGRDAKIYRLLAPGRRRLERERERWLARSDAATRILRGSS